MRRGFMVALLLCVGLVFGATTPQPSELKKVPKSEIAKLQETFKTLKKKQDTTTRAILDVNTFTFDPNTDDLYQFTFNGQQLFLATRLNQTTFAPVQIVYVTKEKYGQTLCAFMGIYDAYSSFDSRVGINAAGGWFYLTKYPTTDVVIFDRSSWNIKDGNEQISFRFVISKRGQAEIHRSLSPKVLTTTEVVTPKKIPLNQWVYIQGKQNGLMHTVGWKTADDESIASREFARASADLQVIPMRSAFMHEVYTNGASLVGSDLYPPNISTEQIRFDNGDIYGKAPALDCTTYVYTTPFIFLDNSQNLAVQEFFYQPLMEMFALMDNYDALDKDMAQKPTTNFNLDTALLYELINAVSDNSTIFFYAPVIKNERAVADGNFDVYLASNGDVVVFDLRRVPPKR